MSTNIARYVNPFKQSMHIHTTANVPIGLNSLGGGNSIGYILKEVEDVPFCITKTKQ